MIFQRRHIPAKQDGCQPSALREKKKIDKSFPHPRSHTFMPSLGPSCLSTCCSLRKKRKKTGSFLISLLACFFSFLPLCAGEGRVTAKSHGSAESWSGSERGWGSFSLMQMFVRFFPFSSKPSFCNIFRVKNCPRWLHLRSVDLLIP